MSQNILQKLDREIEAAWEIGLTDTDKAFRESRRAFNEARRLGYARGVAMSRRNLGYCYLVLSNVEKSWGHLKKAIAELESLGEKKAEATARDSMAFVFDLVGDYTTALEYAFESLRLNEEVNYTRGIAWSHHSLSLIYRNISDEKNSNEHLRRSLEIFQEIDYTPGEAFAHIQLGRNYLSADEIDKARNAIQRSIELSRQAGILLFEGWAWAEMGEVQSRSKQFALAEKSFSLALDAFKVQKNAFVASDIHLKMGECRMDQRKYPEALRSLKYSLRIADAAGAKPQTHRIHRALARLYSENERYKKALYHSERYQEIREDFFSEEASIRLRNFEVLLRIEKTTRKAEVDRLEYIGTDPLTNLPNRSKLESAVRRGRQTIILFNLDSFSFINNGYGLQVGDRVLKIMGEKLRRLSSKVGTLYRLQADEFVLHYTCHEDPIAFTELVLGKFEKAKLRLDEIDLYPRFSAGVVVDGEENLLQKADLALREARTHSNKKYTVYSENLEIEKERIQILNWSRELRVALGDGAIVPFFQGIRDNRTGAITRYESLVRMKRGEDIVSPFFFLGAARKSGLMRDVTEHVLTGSFRYFSENSGRFSINLSEQDLNHDRLIPTISSLLEKYRVAPENVTFEILESFAARNPRAIVLLLSGIKALGCKIAIDDFGVEYSNFSRLLDLSVDCIKIDGSFIKNIDTDKKSYQVVKYVTEFAHSIGAEVVAEFVHSQAVQDRIMELGVDHSQGFLFHEPMADPLGKTMAVA